MPNPQVAFPAYFTPANAVAFANPDSSAQVVSAVTPLPVSLSGTQPVSAAALPLPAGAASAANQATTNASLSAISGQLPASLGAKTGAASLSFTMAGDQSSIEPAGAPITGMTMPSGGTGLTGWLSALYRTCTEGAVIAGSASSAAVVVTASNNSYMGGAFQVTSAGTTCTITYEQSNDGTTWIALPVVSASAPTAAATTTSSIVGVFAYASPAAFVRARVSTYGSGTVSVALSQKTQMAPISGVSLAGGGSAIGTVTVSGTSSAINAGIGFTDSVAALAAAATFTGTGRANNAAQYAFFNACAFADQPGTLFIDQSLDTGATYQSLVSQAAAASSAANLSVRLCGAVGAATLYRVRYVNGGTLQSTFRLSSGFSAS
jgi:hypothetical protein